MITSLRHGENRRVHGKIYTFTLEPGKEQAGAELGQAQLKLELELCFTSFEICCI